jgi:predicted RNase H-like HicB family nuclease
VKIKRVKNKSVRKYNSPEPFYDRINIPRQEEDIMGKRYNIEYTVQIWKEGNQYIAHAMPLDVMSCGPTPDDARKNLDEAVHLFLVTAAEMGTLEEILEEAGYERSNGVWSGPSWVAIERHSAVIGA